MIAPSGSSGSAAPAGPSASLSDKLNPTHPAFDAAFKERWNSMTRKEKKAFVDADLQALQQRNEAAPPPVHPFPTTEDDHCETPREAYDDIAPVLRQIAAGLGKEPGQLAIWDPFYCNGAVIRHLAAAGFENVYNRCEDFYAVVREGRAPAFDVLLTNPAYSGDHIPCLLDIAVKAGKPFLLLMPNYVCQKEYFAAAQARGPPASRVVFLFPPKRYSYWTPRGLRTKTQSHAGAEGHRTSPFISFWYCFLGPHEAAVLRALAAGAEGARLRCARTCGELPKAVRPGPAAGGGPAASTSAAGGGPPASMSLGGAGSAGAAHAGGASVAGAPSIAALAPAADGGSVGSAASMAGESAASAGLRDAAAGTDSTGESADGSRLQASGKKRRRPAVSAGAAAAAPPSAAGAAAAPAKRSRTEAPPHAPSTAAVAGAGASAVEHSAAADLAFPERGELDGATGTAPKAGAPKGSQAASSSVAGHASLTPKELKKAQRQRKRADRWAAIRSAKVGKHHKPPTPAVTAASEPSA